MRVFVDKDNREMRAHEMCKMPARVLVLAIAMIVAGGVLGTALVGAGTTSKTKKAVSFVDMSEKHWASNSVYELAAEGIVSGYPDGSFKPDGIVTYGEFIKMAYVACTGNETANAGGGAHWSENYYYAALAEEFFDDGLLNKRLLAAPIPRKHMAHIAASIIRAAETERESAQRTAGSKSVGAVAVTTQVAIRANEQNDGNTDLDIKKELFLDITEVSENSYDIMTACRAGILNGYEDNTFGPDKTLTRAEAATVISRLWKYSENKGLGFTGEDAEALGEDAEALGEDEEAFDREQGITTEKPEEKPEDREKGSAQYEGGSHKTNEVVVRRAETSSGIVPVKYDVYTGSLSDMGIEKLEYASANTIKIYSSVKHDFVFIMLEDGTLLDPVGFPGGYSSKEDELYVYVANPKGRDLTGKDLYFMFEDGTRVYKFEEVVL